MPISTYADLKDAILRWLLRENTDLVVTNEQLENYISLCEAEINRELKVKDLQDTEAVNTAEDQDYVALPSGYKKIISFNYDTAPKEIIYEGSVEALAEKYSNAKARPQAYTIRGGNIIFNCPADAVHAMSMDFYSTVTSLSDINTTNTILTQFPDAYLYGSLKHAGLQIFDKEKLESFATAFSNAIDRILLDDSSVKMPANAQIRPRRIIC